MNTNALRQESNAYDSPDSRNQAQTLKNNDSVPSQPASDSSPESLRFKMKANPMEHIARAQLKIIDFNHSRMFNLDDSPFRIRKRRRTTREDMTDDDVW